MLISIIHLFASWPYFDIISSRALFQKEEGAFGIGFCSFLRDGWLLNPGCSVAIYDAQFSSGAVRMRA